MQKKRYRDPLIRVRIARMRFPNICPVCSRSATTMTRFTMIPFGKYHLRPQDRPTPVQRMSLQSSIKLSIPVCDQHEYSSGDTWRARTYCTLCDAIAIVLLVFGFMTSTSSILSGRSAPFWFTAVLGSVPLLAVLSHYFLGASPLESSLGIVGFDFDIQHVWLKIKNQQYREAFFEINSTNAELVNWIVKV